MRSFLRSIRELFLLPKTIRGQSAASPAQKIAGVITAGVVATAFFSLVFQGSGLAWDWTLLRPYWRLYWAGWWLSLALASASLIASAGFGALLAWASRSRLLFLCYAAQSVIQVVRSTPFLVQIYILFYIVAEAIGLQNRFLAGVLALSIFSGAYLAEILRAGIETVGASQLESAAAIGLSRFQTFRYVVIPQALRASLPAIAGQFVSLIKDSSLLSIIGLNELTQNARNVASYTFSNFESYLLLAAGYCLLTLPLSWATHRLERRLRYET